MTSARLFTLAWRIVPRIPEAAGRRLFDAVAQLAHLLRVPAVRQLETNLTRIRPDLQGRGLRTVSRAGMRSYLRYFHEVFMLRTLSAEQLHARVRTVDEHVAKDHFDQGVSVVAALGHAGNWDLAGAWCGRHLAPVLTVAEVLEPAELFEEFLAFRADLGMDVVGLTKDGTVMRTLASKAGARAQLVPLLADRDLSRTSLEVDAGGHTMRVAAGPAVLATRERLPLIQIFIRHERLEGERRRRAGSPWGIVVEFTPIHVPDAAGIEDEAAHVRALTQAWVDVLLARVRRHPDQWHMLAKVFTADLDPARLARAHARACEESPDP